MKIRQLQCFVVLAEELNFTRAAKRLHMSQPPLSLQIQSLERSLGADLFERSSRRIALTPVGGAFLHRARSILAQHDRALAEVREVMAGQHGTLNVGITGSILRAGLADLLALFCASKPGISVRLHEQAPALQVSDLISGRMDVIFNRSPPAHADLTCELAWQEELVVMLHDQHPLCAKDAIALTDLLDQPHVILRPDSSDFATHIKSLITRGSRPPQISQQVLDAQSIPSLVAAGFGVSIVPAGIATLTAGPLAFRPIAPTPPVTDIFTIYRVAEENPLVAIFLADVRGISTRRQPDRSGWMDSESKNRPF